VLGARHDGRPYTRAQVRVLESLAHVAATALDAAATARDLEMRVREKTTSLERAVADRQDVLHTAERIGRADDAAEIEAALEDFAKRRGARARWHTGATGAPQGRGRRLEASLGERALAVDGLPAPRLAEMAPQLDTLCAFAGIALGRLALLRELEIEVERQAGEIADITSRRLHAEFVRGVAHELRKPTEEVRRRVQALCEEGNPRRRRHELGRVRAATRELSRRLDLLLFHSGLRLDRRRVELVRIAREALEAARRACPDRDWAQEHLDPRIPLIGDPSRILSVAENLLDNATRATRPGQRIRVCTRIERPGLAHGVAVLEVEDAGVGIEAERLDDVFDPGVCFAPGGFGLGLAVCREIVAMHGGDIGVESRPGRTLFRVRWPQLPPADEGRA
jgi:signal transduction histidine kinase